MKKGEYRGSIYTMNERDLENSIREIKKDGASEKSSLLPSCFYIH